MDPTKARNDYSSRTKDHSGSSLGTNVDSGYASRSSHSTAPSTLPSVKIFHSAQEHQKPSDKPSPATSRNTYIETLDSLRENDEASDSDYFAYTQPLFNDAVPSDPTQFARLFPSRKSFIIKHDDSVADGHMNLRLDTVYDRPNRRSKKLTLFYLRMYELETRHFAVRRYGRDCGREVANTSRKFTKPNATRPGLPRSVSKAFQSFRGKQEMGIKRQDSGLSSSDEEDGEVDHNEPRATNTCTLDFSNYARIELNRKGQRTNKKYDFEYWGKEYTWKRTVMRGGSNDCTTFTMYEASSSTPLATITPLEDDSISPSDRHRGRFVPASELRFCVPERDMRKPSFVDLADVIVTTGFIALVDDCLKRLSTTTSQKKSKAVAFSLPMSPAKIQLEYVGARKIFDEVFKRSPSRPSTPVRSPASTPTRGGVERTQTQMSPSPTKTPVRRVPVRAWTSPPKFVMAQ